MDLYRDQITLKKKNGETLSNIKSSVQGNKIYIPHPKFVLDQHDLLIRVASNGAEEVYRVISADLREDPTLGHYDVTVQKLGWDDAQAAIQNVTYNVSGNNARINENSTDNSMNVSIGNNEALELVEGLRNEIACLNLDDADRKAAIELVDGIQSQVEGGQPSQTVVKALLHSLPHVAAVASIGGQILDLIG